MSMTSAVCSSTISFTPSSLRGRLLFPSHSFSRPFLPLRNRWRIAGCRLLVPEPSSLDSKMVGPSQSQRIDQLEEKFEGLHERIAEEIRSSMEKAVTNLQQTMASQLSASVEKLAANLRSEPPVEPGETDERAARNHTEMTTRFEKVRSTQETLQEEMRDLVSRFGGGQGGVSGGRCGASGSSSGWRFKRKEVIKREE